MLSYAPPVRARRRKFLVIPFGLLTTAAALFGVFLLAHRRQTQIMGWHYLYIIPYGAMIVGAVAGVGYAIAGWLADFRVRQSVFWLVVLLQTLAYFSSFYVEFVTLGPYYDVATRRQVGFFEYFDDITTSMKWVGERETLGMAGYTFRALELAGFVFGGVIWLAFLTGSDYCDLCSRYRKHRLLALIPASAPYPRELNDQTRAAFEADSAREMERAEERLAQLDQLAADGDAATFTAEIDQGRAAGRGAAKLATRIRMELAYCPSCYDGILDQRVEMGQEIERKKIPLPSIDLTRDFVSAIVRGGG